MIIYYKSLNLSALTRSPLILISDIDNRKTDTLTVKISDSNCSSLIINGKRYMLNNGMAKITPSDIQDGISEVIFISGTRKIHASPFFKSEHGIDRLPIDNSAAKAIEELIISLCKRLENAEEKIGLLEEKIIPKSILKFT